MWVAFCLALYPAVTIHAVEPPPSSFSERHVGESFRDCPDCPEMVRMPAGSFRMGSPENKGFHDERPEHTVHVPAFSIGKYAVTFEEWDACVSAGGCTKQPGDEGWGRGRRPVINVSWDDAQQYVRWLSAKTGHKYRLPSEAEWEYAARARTTTAYYWGNEFGISHANCPDCGVSGTWQTVPVGGYDPNPWKLYDMLGNVWQWTQDCWHDSYHGAPKDGSGWANGVDCSRHVVRGGGWATDDLRTAQRAPNLVDADRETGFRLARDAD
jgi:formylglycine-generating enzyme required for sulfatase activity